MLLQDVDAQIKEIQLEILKVELQSKQKDFAEKSSRWAIFRNPAVVAAMITANVALASLIFGSITSYYQANSETEKLQSQIKQNVLLEATKPKDNQEIARKIEFFLNTGIIKDDKNGSLRSFVTKYNPITPLPVPNPQNQYQSKPQPSVSKSP